MLFGKLQMRNLEQENNAREIRELSRVTYTQNIYFQCIMIYFPA